MKLTYTLIFLTFITACASRTDYQAFEEGEGGYRHKKIDENLYLVNFVGNKETAKKTALHFANFRAIQMCKEKSYKYYHPLYVSGDIDEETVVRTYPSYYGISPFYSGFGYPGTGLASGFGAFGGYYGYGLNAYRATDVDTIEYPEATVIFECANRVYAPVLELKELSSDELGFESRDDKGGLKVVSIPEGSPNEKNLQKGDIILKAAGERVLNAYNLIKLFAPNRQVIEVELMRNGKRMSKKVYATEVTQKIAKHQKEEIQTTCEIEDFEHDACK